MTLLSIRAVGGAVQPLPIIYTHTWGVTERGEAAELFITYCHSHTVNMTDTRVRAQTSRLGYCLQTSSIMAELLLVTVQLLPREKMFVNNNNTSFYIRN